MKKIKQHTILFLLVFCNCPYILSAQTKTCYIWVTDHWERPKANVQYPPDSIHCFDNLPDAGPAGGIKVTPRPKDVTITQVGTIVKGNVRDHRNETMMIEETGTEKNFKIISLSNVIPANQDLWSKAVNDQLGVIGSDYRGFEEIGSACFERAAAAIYIPNNLNFWFPQSQTSTQPTDLKYYKRTLIGKIDSRHRPEIQNLRDAFEDFDLNVFVKPDPKYMYLIDEGHKPELSKKQYIRELRDNASIRHPWETTITGCPTAFTGVETEIELGNDAEEKFVPLMNAMIEKPIGVYGPWIWDEGHCCQPEIHPSEQVWWSNTNGTQKTYNLNVFCDASKRFWWRSQMEGDRKLKPWGAPPIKATFAIAFEVDLGNGITANSGSQKVFEVSNISNFNVRDYAITDNLITNKIHNLNYQGKNIVSFIPHNNAFKISFEKVGLVPATSSKGSSYVRGFIVIETEVGTCVLKNKTVTIRNPLYNTNPRNLQPPFITTTVPDNADSNTVSEEIEQKACEKIDGHYMFIVTEYIKNNNTSNVKEAINLEYKIK